VALDDESKKSSESTGVDDVGVGVGVAAAAGLPVTALRRHVPWDFGGPFQDGSLVVAMQDLSLLCSSSSALFPSVFPSVSPHQFSALPFPVGPRCCAGTPFQLDLPASLPLPLLSRACGTAVKTLKLREQQRRGIFCSVRRVRGFPRNPCFGCIGGSLSPGQKSLRIPPPHRGLRLFFVRFLSLPLPSGDTQFCSTV